LHVNGNNELRENMEELPWLREDVVVMVDGGGVGGSRCSW